MMNVPRFDAEAARNILTMLQEESPRDYAILMQRLKNQAGMAGLGLAAEDESPGFWASLLDLGSGALTTIADYKLQEQVSQYQQESLQQQYDDAVATEMARQAALSEQLRTQQIEYEMQRALQQQTLDLQAAASRAKSKFNWAIAAAGALGVWLVFRLVA